MHTNSQKNTAICTVLTLGFVILMAAACSPADKASRSVQTPEALTSPLLLSQAPANTISVWDAREQATPGKPIQVSGQIGGTAQPFVEGYAGFVLADPRIDFCNELGDDHCEVPWDACCEDPDKLKSMRIAVQFVDRTGLPIAADLKQSIGLKELDQVAITGTVASSSTPDNVIIDATGIYKL